LGTQVFYLPRSDVTVNSWLPNVRVAKLGDPGTVVPNSWVQVVLHTNRSTFNVMHTYVLFERDGHFPAYMDNVPIMHLYDGEKVVQDGDSGGGVFYDGFLVGNLWSIDNLKITDGEKVTYERLPSFTAARLPNWVLLAAAPPSTPNP